ncbi:MAG: aminotransferase class I/II-fold pyridoxal phosphate-dependent enzyme [Firmicutes bacterium]|nr:aminotransferase class I/II-fold pyridoxal phosphate-dependent enzyme [Bacillota bacterium]
MYDFDTLVNRSGIGNMKDLLLPESIRKQGMIAFSGAEMDFKTAPSVVGAVNKRVENGLFGFTVKDRSYLQAVGWWLREVRAWPVDADWIVPTLGTIFSLATAIRMTTKVGEGIIIQPPVYYRYEQAASRLKRKTVNNPLILENGQYHMDFDNLEKCMADPNNKLFVLCNPHNPIARVWPEADLKQLAGLARKYGVVVFSDEIFAEVAFEGHRVTPYAALAEAEELAIVATSLGKTFNFTGVNHANIIIPDNRLREAFIAQRDADHFGSIDPLVHAAVCGAYCPEGLEWVEAMREYVAANICFLQEFVGKKLPNIKVLPVEGAFIAWLDMRGLGLSEPELMTFLEQQAYLCVDPGGDYGVGGKGFVRMNIATPRKELERALSLLAEAVNTQFPAACLSCAR